MARTLIIFGLGLIAAWVLLKLVSLVMEVAVWAGGLLVVVGVAWHFLERSRKKRRDGWRGRGGDVVIFVHRGRACEEARRAGGRMIGGMCDSCARRQ